MATRIDSALGFDPSNPETFEQAKILAAEFVCLSVRDNAPCAFEVVKRRGRFVVQPFGLHFGGLRGDRTIHIEPIPKANRHA